jgi:hypothetical protein
MTYKWVGQPMKFTLYSLAPVGELGGALELGGAVTEGTTVFRAVDETEATIIKNSNQFSLQEGGVEVKYFAKSVEDAHWYGQKLYPDGYSIILGKVNAPLNANQYWFPHIDIGAYAFPKEALPLITPH